MDTSDPDIDFDSHGICIRCKMAMEYLSSDPVGLPIVQKSAKLNDLVGIIKERNKNRRYDCIIGLSGGVDSTYTALKVKELGLRPLAVHLDNGWNSELAQENIENIVKRLNFDLYTYVINWEEFKDLQLSFLKASTPDSEIPSDHAIFAVLFERASKNGVKYIVSGTNYATESILPAAWSQGFLDWKYISSIQKRFGKHKLKSFPKRTRFKDRIYKRIKKIEVINILDYYDYVKKDAMQEIKYKLNWREYGGKHHESKYTKFFQAYILPTKFGFDKRRSHLSSLICSGQITRPEALKEIEKDVYPENELKTDIDFVISKFGITKEEFDRIMKASPKKFSDYPSYANSTYLKIIKKIKSLIGMK